MINVSFYTLGCNVNVAETEKMRALFLENGYAASEGDSADAIVLNTCAVTSSADKSARQLLRRLREKNPKSVIAVVGCFGELLSKDKTPILPDADIVLGNDKFDIVNRVDAIVKKKRPERTDSAAASGAPNMRAYVQIQNGCDNYCTYCIVPYMRGAPTSKPLSGIRDELCALADKGVKEIVLSGINLALYKDGANTLADVLCEANAIQGLERIRMSSLEPGVMTGTFIERLPELDKVCPHFHISLQSGCDATLSAMNRNYTMGTYLSMLDRLRGAVKGVAVTTDIIVGFPGESERHFEESCAGIVKCRFSDIHIFKYSKREGTAAASMPDHITEHKKILRATQLLGIKMQTRYSYAHTFLGTEQRVLFDKQCSPGVWEGATPHNLGVRVASEEPLHGALRGVMITGIGDNGDHLSGELR